jgi:hypothetical protein
MQRVLVLTCLLVLCSGQYYEPNDAIQQMFPNVMASSGFQNQAPIWAVPNARMPQQVPPVFMSPYMNGVPNALQFPSFPAYSQQMPSLSLATQEEMTEQPPVVNQPVTTEPQLVVPATQPQAALPQSEEKQAETTNQAVSEKQEHVSSPPAALHQALSQPIQEPLPFDDPAKVMEWGLGIGLPHMSAEELNQVLESAQEIIATRNHDPHSESVADRKRQQALVEQMTASWKNNAPSSLEHEMSAILATLAHTYNLPPVGHIENYILKEQLQSMWEKLHSKA